MSNMRAKLRVSNVETFTNSAGETTQENLTFNAVGKNGSYPSDGSDEDNTFAKYTPNAELKMTVMNPALFGQFNIGDTYYVDFSKVE